MICPQCNGVGGVVSLTFVSSELLEAFIETKMGGPPKNCIVGKSVDLRLTIDVLELCDLTDGPWKTWAEEVRRSRAEVQLGYNKRDTIEEYVQGNKV